MEPNELSKTKLTEDEQHDEELSVEGHLLKGSRLTEEPAPEGVRRVSRVDGADDEFDVEGHRLKV